MGTSATFQSGCTSRCALCLNPLPNIFPVNRNICRGGDSYLHLLTANAQHLDADVVVDADCFASAAGEYQHGPSPWLFPQCTRVTRCISENFHLHRPTFAFTSIPVRPLAVQSSRSLSSYALRMRSPVPSADMRSNRCVPLRGTSAGYASASSASIRLLKSGSLRCVAAMG